jgi:hypothetical protein
MLCQLLQSILCISSWEKDVVSTVANYLCISSWAEEFVFISCKVFFVSAAG